MLITYIVPFQQLKFALQSNVQSIKKKEGKNINIQEKNGAVT